jgi:nucleoside 2-deoxyribosyltransferase
MKIYVAGKFENYQEVRRVQEFLKHAGHIITFDWTKEAEKTVLYRTHDAERSNAEQDMEGVLKADITIALMGGDLYGTLIEIGMALGDGQDVFLIGQPARDSVFWALDEVTILGGPLELLTAFGHPNYDG